MKKGALGEIMGNHWFAGLLFHIKDKELIICQERHKTLHRDETDKVSFNDILTENCVGH